MASLDKLAIRGVRSFDDKSINIIQFFHPLTVIVGYNGSGKTTIIECLKYATTGDLPPNTKGGAFVHDPQMATSNEVKAQVRLRFYAANKVRMNCVRNLQVSRKKGGGLTMKTLEGLLQIADDDAKTGKRGTLSTKCSELDEEIPRLLGVSKSILENVIFCHQEDSNWPLSEPASLKKKFDDIFEATRYTKALDNIKSLRKDRTVQLKVDKAALEGLKVDKDRADTIKTKLTHLQADLAQKEAKLEDLNDEIRVKTVQNSKFYDEATRFREIVSRAETLEEKERLHKENMEALQASMTPIKDTDEELQQRKQRFQSHLDQNQNKIHSLKRRQAEKEDELESNEQRHRKKLSEKGGLEAEKRAHVQAKERRESSIKQIANELGIKGFGGDGLTDTQIRSFEDRVKDEVRKLDDELARLREANSKKDDELTTVWQNMRADLRAKQTAREQLTDSVRKLREKIKRAQDELDGYALSSSDIEGAERDRDSLSAKVTAAQKEFEEARYDDQIRKKNTEIREKDDLREERTSEINLLNRHAELRASLALKMQQATTRKNNAQELLDRHKAALDERVRTGVELKEVESEVTRALSKREKRLEEVEADNAERNRELQQVESAISFARKQLVSKQAMAVELQKAVQDILSPDFDDVEEAVKVCAEEIAAAKDEYASIDSLDSFLRRVLREAKGKGHCFACNRGVSPSEYEAIEKHVSSTLSSSNTAQKKKALKADIDAWTERNAECQTALAKDAQRKVIQDVEIVELKTTIANKEAELNVAAEAAEKSSAEVTKLQAEVKELQTLRRTGGDIARLLSEANDLDAEVQNLQSDLASTGSTQTGEQVQADIDQLAASIKVLKRELNVLQQDRETKRTLINSLERDAHRAEVTVMTKRQEYAKKASVEQQLQEMNVELEEHQKRTKGLDGEIESSSAPIRCAKDELESFKAEASEAESKLKARADKLEGWAKQIRELNAAVNAYIQQRGDQRLEECEEAIQELVDKIQAIHREVKELTDKVAELQKEVNQSQATERNIVDNIRYRQLAKDVAKIEEEINSLDLEQAQRSRKHFADKYTEAKEEENRLNGEASHLSGELASLRSQIKGRELELRDEFKGVHQNYKRKLIEVKTSEMANNDLEKYAKALENAIMRYHSIKMEEINDIIRYLWQKTYQGTDIDTILIKSDNEGARGNRSYNYRVCMVKDTVEMDMRGRCSAGQKVLASIIIRLALAESFGSNCGILALDEPTTNLDKDNIESLARSLADLIKERAENSQLQLIVITHDEDFLTLLGQNDVLEYYWRVSRDVHQKSIIERERIRNT
ncbi:DNA repair protein RAD50 [Pseudozyma hubeiensis SY62]|uniref:DNA repair protein RAD50 n=1 Tax=Pseudozyma hubeiensis (strain SY62) TaxID=1305764 RepID=R9PGF2_PSEHS|nr:DNA repair protein RAD50 [Pseudozyma hubeiensis SY62]GAC97185.1 DNA repair protein RAD50 [Pseudozyma hubeiensis SY62]DBA11381.1 TPA_inf: RAD50 [Pseudozyma hubeiensis]